MRLLIGVVGAALILVFVLSLRGQPDLFIDIRSLMIYVSLTFFLAITKFSFKELRNYSEDVADSLIGISVMGGCLGTMMGLIQMLMDLSDFQQIGPRLAVSLLPILYSLLVAAVFRALRANLNKKRLSDEHV